MKSLRVIGVLLIAATFLMPQTADAQFRRLREKVRQTVENKVEQKIEEKVEQRAERALDRAVGNAVDALADNLESSLENMLFSDAPEPIELGPNESGSPDAPYVQYTLASRISLGGAEGGGLVGRILQRYGSQQQTVYTHGDKQRIDSGNESSQVMDAGNARIISIDHERKQWWAMSFEEMMASIEQMAEQAQASMEEAKAEAKAEGEQNVSMQVTKANVTVDHTGKTKTINGSTATQTIMVVEGEYEITGQNEETGEQETFRGKTYAVYDAWQSKDLAGINTITAYQTRAAESMGAAVAGSGLGEMLAVMQSTVQIPEGTEDALSSLEPEDGLPVRTKLYLVQVAENATLDLQAVLSGAPAAEPASENEMPSQFILLTVTTEIGELTTAPFDAGVFDPPSTYTEVSSPMKQ